ncbi:uncharacterized protein EAE98_006872 [Botrytis deweyae]|uniref:Uncharacterized protein n=1 Tax=Botrytis deweyae TaxID=2478750 RepID=A0ABQ7IIY1_9HELO|nr:uncharacterized protein EAE98_006872 [Botrytis deweyae]KAF7925647.1 hypothetical protein EAE98_006872 [Botrytis deweyae]
MPRSLKLIALLLVTVTTIFLYQAIKKYNQPPPTLSENIMSYIQAHPFKSAFHVINIVTFFTPAAACGPFLYLLGFTRLGPRAVSIASISHSIFGNVAARSLFAYFQSAAMNGYGLGALNTVVRSVSGIGSFVGFFWGGKAVRMNDTWDYLQDFVGDLSVCVVLALLLYVLVRIGVMGYRLLDGVIRPVDIQSEQVLGEAGE